MCVTKTKPTKPNMQPASAILESLNTEALRPDNDDAPSREWWLPMNAGRMRTISFAQISRNADREYAKFRKVASKLRPRSNYCLLYTSPSPRDRTRSRMPSSA